MSRIIKFRAWDNTSKDIGGQRMLSWDELTQYEAEFGESFYISAMFSSENKDLLPMQLTGLTDRLGVEIYEGDVLKMTYPAGYSLYEVKFGNYDNGEEYESNESGIGWFTEEHAHYTDEGIVEIRICSMVGYPLEHYEHEVIGNIWKNPELLEKDDGQNKETDTV